MLILLLIIPIIGIILIALQSSHRKSWTIALCTTIITFLYNIWIWLIMDNSVSGFQLVTKYPILPTINFIIGVDGISILMLLLTTLLFPICILASWDLKLGAILQGNGNSSNPINQEKEYLILFILMEVLLIGTFMALDLLIFYVFFESILIPMFIIIGVWGSSKSSLAATYFFLFTLAGSLFLLLAILYLEKTTGTTDYIYLQSILQGTNKIGIENAIEETIIWVKKPYIQLWLWLGFFASLAVKVPLVPFHIWLPMAHVEAPAVASALLAGILLKIGSYGFIRFLLPLFPFASVYFTPLVMTLSLLGVVYGSLTTLRQIDLKRIIAYSSISHVALSIIGIFTFTIQGIEGSILYQISHGLTSAALFLSIGFIYDRWHTRLLKYYRGLTVVMPIFSTILAFFIFASIGIPPTLPFISELLVLVSTFYINTFICIVASTGLVLGAAYSLWLYTRLAFGVHSIHLSAGRDLSRREFYLIFPFILLILLLGLYPNLILDTIHMPVSSILSGFK